jgi:thiosulfate/3-mercaptopyruvate sulfurtransferase
MYRRQVWLTHKARRSRRLPMPRKNSLQPGSKDRRVIAYCGGGTSATVDLFLLHQLGFDDLTLYDGSMGEWAKDPGLPIEKG